MLPWATQEFLKPSILVLKLISGNKAVFIMCPFTKGRKMAKFLNKCKIFLKMQLHCFFKSAKTQLVVF